MNSVDPDTRLNAARVATDAVSTTSIVGVRLACQAFALMLSARLLGVDGFGLVAAAVALSLVLGPWSGLGYDFIALRATSRNEGSSSEHFWHGLSLIIKSALPMILVSSVVVWWWVGDPVAVQLTVLVLCAELLLLRSVELIAKVFQGNDLFREMALTRLAISLSRLAVLGIIAMFVSGLSAPQWGWANLVASLCALAVAVVFMHKRLGLEAPRRGTKAPGLHDGLHFAAGITSMRLSTEFDKSLVLGIAGALGAGIYGAAHRIVSLAVAPVISLVNVVITSLFRLNSDVGGTRLRKKSLAVCGIASLYGIAVGVFLWLYLPDIAAVALGEEFRALAAGLLPLSLLVVPTSCRMVGEQAVAAMGRFKLRLAVQWVVAALSITLNLIMIARFGWQGAAWVLVASETILAVSFLLILALLPPLLPEEQP